MAKCPGSDKRFLSAKDVTCTRCGASVELFSDELRRRCPFCDAGVASADSNTCATWCDSARACIGAKRHDELLGSGSAAPEADGPAED